ncbi:MAG: hypothetical protein JXB88_11390 [Spirochaetales bacterium]|nr:hypothetical protein [Spirochaetales bacterium]
MIPVSGFYSLSRDQKTYLSCEIEKTLSTHTGINRQTGTVSESILYNMETIERTCSFTGRLYLNEDLCPVFLPWISNREIHIGAKKTAGLGRCIVEIEEFPAVSFSDFKHRLERFDTEYKEYRKRHFQKQNKTGNESFYYSIDLISEAIRIDPFLNYITGFKGLEEEELTGCRLVFEKTRSFEILGWNSTLGLPRQTETGIEKGSTVMYTSTKPGDELFKTLYTLENNGIGIRRTEGYGQIIVSSNFHNKGNIGL